MKKLPLRGPFPGLRDLLVGVSMLIAANDARLSAKVLNDEGLVSVELKVPRDKSYSLTFSLGFTSHLHAKEFCKLANKRLDGIPEYSFKSDDDCSLEAVPTSDHRELFDAFDIKIPLQATKYSTILEMRKHLIGLDVLLNVITRFANTRISKRKLAYTGIASLSTDSKRLTLKFTHSDTASFCVSFSGQLMDLDFETMGLTTRLNGAFSNQAPVLFVSDDDCSMGVVIGKPKTKQAQKLMDGVFSAVDSSQERI